MVSREEYDFASKWFRRRYLENTQPLGSDIENYSVLSDTDLLRATIKSNTLVGTIYGDFLDNNGQFTETQITNSVNFFGDTPENLLNEFTAELRSKIRGVTKGPALARIAPFLLLNDDVVDIIFEFTVNECTTQNLMVEDKLLIPAGCLLVYFDYDHKAKERMELDPYENKHEKYIIIDGNQLAEVMKIDVEFLKSRVISSIVPNSSKLVAKIRQNPSVFIDCDSTTRKWLYKSQVPIGFTMKKFHHQHQDLKI